MTTADEQRRGVGSRHLRVAQEGQPRRVAPQKAEFRAAYFVFSGPPGVANPFGLTCGGGAGSVGLTTDWSGPQPAIKQPIATRTSVRNNTVIFSPPGR